MATETTYTTTGSVRGNCGHQHIGLEEALDCMARDQHGCEQQGGYSDRRIIAVDEDCTRGLTETEQETLDMLMDERADA